MRKWNDRWFLAGAFLSVIGFSVMAYCIHGWATLPDERSLELIVGTIAGEPKEIGKNRAHYLELGLDTANGPIRAVAELDPRPLHLALNRLKSGMPFEALISDRKADECELWQISSNGAKIVPLAAVISRKKEVFFILTVLYSCLIIFGLGIALSNIPAAEAGGGKP